MGIEIADCPACGDACKFSEGEGLIECVSSSCGYVFVDVYDSKASTITVHNSLARFAGIGRRVVEAAPDLLEQGGKP